MFIPSSTIFWMKLPGYQHFSAALPLVPKVSFNSWRLRLLTVLAAVRSSRSSVAQVPQAWRAIHGHSVVPVVGRFWDTQVIFTMGIFTKISLLGVLTLQVIPVLFDLQELGWNCRTAKLGPGWFPVDLGERCGTGHEQICDIYIGLELRPVTNIKGGMS